MRVVAGRFAEVRIFLWYCWATFRPSTKLPIFAPFAESGPVVASTDEDLKLLVEEGRRQLDRQASDLDRIRSRGATLMTVVLGELALLAAAANRALDSGVLGAVAWCISSALVVLGVSGAAGVISGSAVLGRLDTGNLGSQEGPLLPKVAQSYAEQVGVGEETVRTRLTVLNDAVLCAVVGALVFAFTWAFVLGRSV